MSEIELESGVGVPVHEKDRTIEVTAGHANTVTENGRVIEIQQTGLLSLYSIGGSGDGYLSDQSADTTQFGGITSERSFVRVFLSWAELTVPNHHNITKVLRSETNDVLSAVCVGDSQTQTFTDVVTPGVTYFYWLVGETYAGKKTDPSSVIEVLPTEEGNTLADLLGLGDLLDDLSTLESRLNESYLGAYLNLEELASQNLSDSISLINSSIATVTSNMVQIEQKLGLESENAIALLNERLTIAVDDSNALIERVNTLTAEVNTETEQRLAEISRLELAQVTANSALAQTRDELNASIANEKSLRQANILSERTARVNAEEVLASAVDTLSAQLTSDVADVNAAINSERLTRVTNESATAQQITDITTGFNAAESSLNSRITQEMLSQTSATEALASTVVQLDTDFASRVSQVEASVTEELTSFSNEVESVASKVLTLESNFTGLSGTLSETTALINQESVTRATEFEALAQRTAELEAGFNDSDTGELTARLTVEETTRANEDEALSSQITELETTFTGKDNTTNARITDEVQTLTTADEALATRTGALEANYEALDNTAIRALVTTEQNARTSKDQALADDITELSTQMDTDIGLAKAEAKDYTLSVVGYCTIDGAISDDTTQAACETNGGTWAQLPLSEAMDKVSVSITKPDGSVATGNAGTFFQALSNDVGEIATRAFLGTDVNGRVTGVVATDSSGNESQSNLKLLGSKVEILNDETGVPFVSYDTVNKRGVIRGQLILDDGTAVATGDDIRAMDGSDGIDGDTVYVEYQYSVNGSSNWHTPMANGDVFRRERTVTNGSGGSWSSASKLKGEKGATGPQGPQGPRGNDGTPGPAGADGESNYFHIAYASNSTGTTGFSQVSGKYVGTYVDGDPIDSTDPTKYTWKLWEGAQGEDGTDGIPGVDGTDGKTSYLHIAYADSANGFSNFNQVSGDYIGQYVDFNQQDSSDYRDYTWTKIKGTDGQNGQDGQDGSDGKDGSVGPGFYSIVGNSGVFPTDATATSNFTSTFGFAPKEHDHLTYTNSDNSASEVKRFNGSGWTAPSLVVNGDILTKGTVTAEAIAAKAISADKIDVEDLFSENITVTGSVKAISGTNQAIMSGSNNLLSATVGGKTLFNVTANGDGVVNGRWLTPASIYKNSLSQEVIDFIIGQVGNLAAATGGVRSREITPITMTNYTLAAIPHGTKTVKISLYGSANDTVSGPNYPAAPRVKASIVRDGTVIKEFDFDHGTVEDFSEQGYNQYVRTLNFNVSYEDTNAPNNSEVTYWVNFSDMSSNFPSGSEASFSVSEDGGGGASFGWGSVTGKPDTATRWPSFSEVTGTIDATQLPSKIADFNDGVVNSAYSFDGDVWLSDIRNAVWKDPDSESVVGLNMHTDKWLRYRFGGASDIHGVQLSHYDTAGIYLSRHGYGEFRNDNAALRVRTQNNGVGARIEFSDQTTGDQKGWIDYFHSDGAVASDSNDGFIIGGSEVNTVVRIDGRLDVGSHTVYHEGYKPTYNYNDVGAAAASHSHSDYVVKSSNATLHTLSFTDRGAGKHHLLNTSGQGGLWHVSDRGALMLTSADDSLILANGDVGRNFNLDGSDINFVTESVYLLSDNEIVFKTDLQEGFGTEHTMVFTNTGALEVNGNRVYHRGDKPSKADVGLSRVTNIALNWQWGTGAITHIWGSQGSSTESYVYQPNDLRDAMDIRWSDLQGTLTDSMLPTTQGAKKFQKTAHAFGAYDRHIELYAPEGSAAAEISILFHQGGRFYHQLRARQNGLHVTKGNNGDLSDLYANFKGTLDSSKVVVKGSGTIAGTNFNSGWLQVGHSGDGWSIDPNEIYCSGSGNIGTMSGDLNLNPSAMLKINGGVRLGTAASDILQVTNNSGWVRIGANNTGYAHIYTDRPEFYMSEGVQVDGRIKVYNRYSQLTADGGSLYVGANTSYYSRLENSGAIKRRNSGWANNTTENYILRPSWASYVGDHMLLHAMGNVTTNGALVMGREGFAIGRHDHSDLSPSSLQNVFSTSTWMAVTPATLTFLNKEAFRFSDSWLRINEDKEFSNGIYCGGSTLRTDGNLQVGSSGNAFNANTGGIDLKVTTRVHGVMHLREIRSHDGNFTTIGAGELGSSLRGHVIDTHGLTNEALHLGGESGVYLYSHPNNMSGGMAAGYSIRPIASDGATYINHLDVYKNQNNASQVVARFRHPTQNTNVAWVSKNQEVGSFRIESNADGQDLRIQTADTSGGYGGLTIAKFFRSGNMYVTGEVSSADTRARSDIRVKRNLNEIDNALSKVNSLTGFTYDEINMNKRMASIIAQDVQKVLPEGVGEDTEGMLNVSPMALIGLLVNAVKELSDEVKELKHGNV